MMDAKTKTQHAPGPWKVGDPFEHDGEPSIRTNQPGESEEWFVATAHDFGDNGETAAANARLIAAAPDMLEALKTTLGNLRDLKANAFRNLDTVDEWIAVVEAAIARAEGKS